MQARLEEHHHGPMDPRTFLSNNANPSRQAVPKKPAESSVEQNAEAVAIVGMAFRFPGGMEDEQAFWRALQEGRDLVSAIPDERWAVETLQHPKRGEAGRSITFSAGVLSRIDAFDAQFFGISPREAAWMDPQQRLLLELAWESFENAGQRPSALAGSQCAVYVGIAGLDYGMRALDDLSSITSHFMTGNTLSIVANRLSYVFDLHGPSLAVDTACSSSLVALHHACNSLRSGEAEAALVGGVNLLLHPFPFVGFTKASMLSAQGRCKVFDAEGDGYVRAEGGAMLFLKPLSRALADGDPIKAVILASGTNSDGARNKKGITIPSAEGQSELMRTVLRRSGLAPQQVDFIEAHGTGTAVGDPVETMAIGQVYGQSRPSDRPLPIGSVKSNLGHLEAASGMAGLVKAVLCLQHRALPPSLHLHTPNPHIDFAGLNLSLVTRNTELTPQSGGRLVAGVNSFGFGGANAHVLLQEPPLRLLPGSHRPEPVAAPPLFLSARTHEALRAMAADYARLLREQPAEAYYDLACSVARDREWMAQRLALRAEPTTALPELLEQFAQAGQAAEVVVETALPEAGGVVFVYSGNGAQWHGMGQRLLGESPRFVELLAEVDSVLQPLSGFSVRAELESEASRLDDTTVAQPLLFAMQVTITQLLRERGVQPLLVLGHSVGEVAAAWCAGALDLEQAARLICARSAAQGLTKGSGRMAAVALSAAEAEACIEALGAALEVEIAGINSAGNVTLSGSLADLETLGAELTAKGVFYRLLDLDYAFHSRRMDPIEQPLRESLAELVPTSSSGVHFVSTVTGEQLSTERLDAGYWWRNVREPVQFARGVERAIALGGGCFIEIGPHAILQRYLGEGLKSANRVGRVLPTLRRDDDGPERIEEAALRAHLLAEPPNLTAYFPAVGRRVALPNYPWQRERHWHPVSSESHGLIQRRRIHPLLGWRLSELEAGWENTLDPRSLPWLADHQVGGAVVFPAAAYAEMALAAAQLWHGKPQTGFEQLDIVAPLVFDGERARTLRFTLNPRDGGFQISSRQRLGEEPWALYATGRLLDLPSSEAARSMIAPVAVAERTVDHASHYALTAAVGLGYGPAFQGVRELCIDGDLLEAQLSAPAEVADDSRYLLHPALLDLACQSLVDFFQPQIEAGRGVAFLPIKITRLHRHRETSISSLRARLLRHGLRSVLADFELFDADGALVARMEGCRFRAAPLAVPTHGAPMRWRIVPRLRPHPRDLATSQLPAPAQLADAVRQQFMQHEEALQRQLWFGETLPLIEALTLSFIHEAFMAVAQPGQEALQAAMQGPVAASAYLRWMAELLIEEGLLEEVDGLWRLIPAAELPPAALIWQTLLRDAPAAVAQLTLLGRVGCQLPRLLRGEASADALAREVSHSPLAETLLDEDPLHLGSGWAVRKLLELLQAAQPAGRRLRVLELASGPSALPRHFAAALQEERMEYLLLHGDEVHCQRQQAEFEKMRNVTVLGIDLADWTLSAQKVALQPFDVVVLRHVVHRAPFPHQALAQARQWLTQGGLLLLAEQHADWSADLLGGLDADWWSEDQAQPCRPLSSLQAPEVWRQLLAEAQFEAIELLNEPTLPAGLNAGSHLLLARRPAQIERRAVEPVPEAERWLLLIDETSAALAHPLRQRLEQQGQQVMMAEAETEAHAIAAGCDHLLLLRGWQPFCPETALQWPMALPALIQQLLYSATEVVPQLWLVTHGGALADGLPASATVQPHQGAVWGFGRVLMNECPMFDCTLIDIACDLEAADLAARLSQELLQPDGASEIVLTESARHALCMQQATRQRVADPNGAARYRLDFHLPGKLKNLRWLPAAEQPLAGHEIEVMPRAVGLNFRDVMYLMGLLPDEAVENGFAGASLGLEFAGVVSRVGDAVQDLAPGDAVMGFGASCFASHVVTRAGAVARLPAGWSFASAATVPTVFFTVYYALKHLADLQPGERVLIHGAAGGVGMAAIQLARHLGAEIFATAGSDEKRDFVRLLGADHVFDSRTLAFADQIMEVTAGEGVDVVLNSLAGEAVRCNLRLLKPFGRFLELGKRDFFENTPIGLRVFKENISYFGIDADQLLTARPALAERLFGEVMALFEQRVLTPLPQRSFAAERVVEAFRVMQQSRHIGKIVVTLDAPPVRIEPDAPLPQLQCGKEERWLISGGLSGFGLATAQRLAARGVGHLLLLGRRGADTPDARQAVEALRTSGVEVTPLACDVTDAAAVAELIERIKQQGPPLTGIVHAAMSLDDGLIGSLDTQRMAQVLRPKLLGAWNLHRLTLDLPIRHFVLYSSVTTGIGNPGQANYVAANGALEVLARMRRAAGLPATCIGWGPIGDAGYLSRNEATKAQLEQRLGRPPLTAEQALDQLEQLLSEPCAGPVTVADFDWKVLSRLLPSAHASRFDELNRQFAQKQQGMEQEIDFRTLLADRTPAEAHELLREVVLQQVAQILSLGAERIDRNRSLHELGMDSLMMVELALGLEQQFGIRLPVMLLNEAPTIEQVTVRILDRLLADETSEASGAESLDLLVQQMARQHGEVADAQEIAELANTAKALRDAGRVAG